MTLILTPENNFKGANKGKSDFWEKQGQTPNEAYEHDKTYRKMIREFGQWNQLKGPWRFAQVRIVSTKTSALYTGSTKWWDHKRFMDGMFWMFQTPISEEIDGEHYQYRVLEPFECQRVWRILVRDLGQSIPDYETFKSGLAVPVECCTYGWHETTSGYSDHIHHRPEIVKSQAEKDYEGKVERGSKLILERMMNLDDAGVSAVDPEKLVEGAKNVR